MSSGRATIFSVPAYLSRPTVLTAADLERRKPVWTALSALWLDTELDDADLRGIADALAASGYTVAELRAIYLDELAPVLGPNLASVAGVWAGFDEAWLHEQARRQAEHPGRLRWLSPGRLLTRAIEADWQRLVALLPPS